MNLSVIEQLVGDDSAKITRLLVDSQTLVEQATQEIRTTTYLLHPPLLEAADWPTPSRIMPTASPGGADSRSR